MESSTDAFDTLWTQTHSCLCWFIFSRVGSEEDAEDILQDVFLRVYRQLGTVRDPQRLESWLYQIARNRIIDHYRSRRQWVDLTENLVADADSTKETSEEPSEDLLPYVCEVIEGLPEPDREALLQADYQGMAQQDLACQLGISLSGAKSRVQRARQKVKKALLHCFDFEFDTRGGIMDFQQHRCR
jgi:RNA polymerase sigma-70 factor (ECF subfamily)